MNEIVLRYTLTEDEVVNASRSRVFRAWHMQLFAIAVVVVAIVNLLITINSGDLESILFAVVPPILLGSVFVLLYYGPLTRMRIRNESRYFVEQTWRFGETGTKHQSEHSDSQNAWSAYEKATENKEFFFLFFSKNMIAPIPKRAFANTGELDRFRELLKTKVNLTQI
jgi:hypothetical protein